MGSISSNNQMSVYIDKCILNSHISYSTNSVHVLTQSAQCIICDIDQCKMAGIFFAKMLVICG